MNTTTVNPAACDAEVANTAEQAVQTMKDTSIPAPDIRKSVRRPRRSTRNAADAAAKKLKICKIPLIRVWIVGSRTPTVSKTRVR